MIVKVMALKKTVYVGKSQVHRLNEGDVAELDLKVERDIEYLIATGSVVKTEDQPGAAIQPKAKPVEKKVEPKPVEVEPEPKVGPTKDEAKEEPKEEPKVEPKPKAKATSKKRKK